VSPQDTSRRNTTEFPGALKCGSEGTSVLAGWTTYNVPVEMVSRMACGAFPWAVVGHRAFDREEALVMVGNDEEKLPGRIGIRRRFASHEPQGWHGHVASTRPK
jgi:hypothetical protein